MNDMDKPMNVNEAARYLKIAPGTLKNKCYKNEVPHHKPAGQFYFYKSELDAWIRGETKEEQK